MQFCVPLSDTWRLILSSRDAVTHYIPLSKEAIQAKINSFLAHKSQYNNATLVAAQLTMLGEMVGATVGVQYAETFMGFF
jgi:hypothetical protein